MMDNVPIENYRTQNTTRKMSHAPKFSNSFCHLLNQITFLTTVGLVNY